MRVPIRGPILCRSLAFTLLATLSNCTTLRISQPPRIPKNDSFHSITVSGLELRALSFSSIGDYWDLFDENLPELGIAAVWVSLANRTQEEKNLANARWELFIGGRRCPVLDTPGIFKRYYKGRGVRLVTERADASARHEFDKILLRSEAIEGGKEANGFLFFKIPPAAASTWSRGAILRLRNIHWPTGSIARMELPLSNAKP